MSLLAIQSRAAKAHLHALWAGIETILAFLFPNPRQLLTIHAVQRMGGFDPNHYRRQLGNTYWLYRLFPLHHYAILGEHMGLSPNSSFCPRTYLRLNPDVHDAGVPALWHWLTKGHGECRRVQEHVQPLPLPENLEIPIIRQNRMPRANFAAHIHVHYTEVWDEFLRILCGIRDEMDLYVTLSYQGERTIKFAEKIQVELPLAQVFVLENRGRDILPFLRLTNAGVFDGYTAVCKIHTKRSSHRIDGDRWRRLLINGILSADFKKKLQIFLQDPHAAIWVADGQRLTAKKWWGENRSNVSKLLQRIELPPVSASPYFAAGSMFWIKPFCLGLLRSLDLRAADFETEDGALDGTTAHAIERLIGELAMASGQTIVETQELRPKPKAKLSKPKYVSAFYLPQFHQIPENDRWWGEGYTDWSAVKRAAKQYYGHLQATPTAPLGYYDLSDIANMRSQTALAKSYGVDAFCTYFYWFGSKQLLQKPLANLLSDRSCEFPFYLCWANESWRRNWDGLSGETLIQQEYPESFETKLAQITSQYMQDPRYQRPDGHRPRFVIYRPSELPSPKLNIEKLRAAWRSLGIGEVEIGAVRFHLSQPLPEDLVDFWIEMPPHGFVKSDDYLKGSDRPPGLQDSFRGALYRYETLINTTADPSYVQNLPKNTIRGAAPSWDNSPRRAGAAHIAIGGTPARFRKWLFALAQQGFESSYRQELMINAWNEWGEKAVLEPSLQFQDLNLQAIRELRAID